jgi:hypothetical protein
MISGSGRRRSDAAPPRNVVAAETKRPPRGGRLDSGELGARYRRKPSSPLCLGRPHPSMADGIACQQSPQRRTKRVSRLPSWRFSPRLLGEADIVTLPPNLESLFRGLTWSLEWHAHANVFVCNTEFRSGHWNCFPRRGSPSLSSS